MLVSAKQKYENITYVLNIQLIPILHFLPGLALKKIY